MPAFSMAPRNALAIAWASSELSVIGATHRLELAPQHAALAIVLAGAENHALGRGLRVRLRYAATIGDDADLDRLLRVRRAGDERRAEQYAKHHAPSAKSVSACFA